MAKKRSKSNNKRKKKYKKYTQRSKVVIPQNKLNKNDDRKKDNKDLEEDLKKLKNKIKDKKQQDTVELKYTISTEEMLKDDFKVTIDEHTNNIDIIVEKVKKEDSTKNEQKKKTTNKTSKKIIVGASIILLVTTLYILFMPRIILNGKNTLVINYKQKYKEPGYKAVILNKELNSSIKSYGKVNVNKLGTYKIKYILNYKGIRRIKYRKVIVKDMTKPFIKLNGYKKTYVCPNTKYQEEGFIAYDNYDKDITKKVKIIKDDNKYVYKVKDSSGNKTTSIRNLIYEDNVKPVISISENIFINEGDSYENKYFAIDNCDKDITSKVKVTGSVNSNKAGEYKLLYKVVDKAGNESSAEQIIHVSRKNQPGTIYLTFDDGPQEGTTNVILDILKEENVKATFFITSSGPDELVKREDEEGHIVAIHTSSHNYQTVYSSVEAFYNDLQLVKDRIKRITGKDSMILRFPGGSSNTVSRRYKDKIMTTLTEDVINKGYSYYDWNINSGDADVCHDRECVYNHVTQSLSHDRINMVLMHDIKPYTRDALKDIITYAKENGYTFSVIDKNTQMVRQRVNN